VGSDTPAPEPVAESTPSPSPAPDDAVPWESIDAFHEADRGRYTEVVTVVEDGYAEIVAQETVRFDLALPYVERSFRVPSDKADPLRDLEIVYTDDALLMWHADLLEICGAEWVDMADVDLEEFLGLAMDPADFLAIKPLDVLDLALEAPQHVETTDKGSTYRVTVPADVGATLPDHLLDDDEALATLAETEVVAEVLLSRTGGSLEMTIDYTDALRAVSPKTVPPGALIRNSWTITPDIPEFDTTLPDDVADGSCLDVELETAT
jgi:hypothetical protein